MPNKKDNKYINKPFMLNKDLQDEKKLYEWLGKLPPGQFKQETKAYWMKKMREARNGENANDE